MPATAQPTPGPAGIVRLVEVFLYNEARLLDGGRYEEWLDLWDPAGVYHLPRWGSSSSEQLGDLAFAYESYDELSRRVKYLCRVARLAPGNHLRSARVVANIEVVPDVEPTTWKALSVLYVLEASGELDRQFAGRVEHVLHLSRGALRIRKKTVFLVHSDSLLTDVRTVL